MSYFSVLVFAIFAICQLAIGDDSPSVFENGNRFTISVFELNGVNYKSLITSDDVKKAKKWDIKVEDSIISPSKAVQRAKLQLKELGADMKSIMLWSVTLERISVIDDYFVWKVHFIYASPASSRDIVLGVYLNGIPSKLQIIEDNK